MMIGTDYGQICNILIFVLLLDLFPLDEVLLHLLKVQILLQVQVKELLALDLENGVLRDELVERLDEVRDVGD